MTAKAKGPRLSPRPSQAPPGKAAPINPLNMDMTMTSNNINRTVTTSDLIEIMDTLGTAKTRCAALHMASEALVRDHRDAVSFLANDCDDVINHAVEALQAIVDAAEGHAHG